MTIRLAPVAIAAAIRLVFQDGEGTNAQLIVHRDRLRRLLDSPQPAPE